MAFNGMMNSDCPCVRDCLERTEECHGKCERYLVWRAKRDEENKARFVGKEYGAVMSDAKKRAIWRKMRSSRQVRYNKGKD